MGPFALALLLWVAVDFSNPLLPGAVRLDPSESIDGLPTLAVERHEQPARAPSRPADRATLVKREPGARLAPTRVPTRWRPLLIRASRHRSEHPLSAPPAEDH